jgi:hypothetical protein
MSRKCQHPAVEEVVEVGHLQGSYQAYCPDCRAASGEAVTVDRALTDFHARHGGLLEEFAGGYYFVDREHLLDEGDRPW